MHAIRPDEPFVRAYCLFSIECDSGSVRQLYLPKCYKWYKYRSSIYCLLDRGHINDQSMTKSPFSRKRESPESLEYQGFPGFTTWCGWRDLNPYVMDTRPSNVPVYQFQHIRIWDCLTSILRIITFVKRSFRIFGMILKFYTRLR